MRIKTARQFENLKMKSIVTRCYIVLFLIAVSTSCLAQTKDLGEQQYLVVKDYKPVLAESFKISDAPAKDTSTSTPPALKYSISPHAAATTLEVSPVKPVKIKDESISKLYHSLAKIGLGNYGTTYGELFVNSTRSKTSLLGLHYKHFSASPDLKGVGSAGFSDNSASLYGKLFLDRSVFSADLNYDRNVVHYYGFNTSDTLFDKADTKQRFGNFNIGIGLKSNNINWKDYTNYNVNITYNHLNDLFDAAEDNVRVDGMAGKYISNIYISLNSFYDYNKFSRPEYENNHGLFSLNPSALLIDDGKLNLSAGVRIDIDNTFISAVHFYPDFNFSYTIGGNVVTFFGSLTGGVQKNTLRSLTLTNPYMATDDPLLLLRYSNNVYDAHGGVKGNFNNNIFFAADARFVNTENLPLFINRSAAEGIPKMKVIYDDAAQTQVHAEVGYHSGEKLRLSLSVLHIIYDMLHEEKPWHLPATTVTVSGNYNLAEKIFATADVFFHGSTFALDPETPGGIIELDSWADVNFGAEYRYSKVLSVFVKLNNLGFTRYYLWNGYPTERLNVLGGLTYAF
jgi:hypothetical protein